MMMRQLVLVICLMLGGMHAAHAAFFSDDEARKKIAELQQQLTQLQGQIQAKLDDESKQRQALEGRVVPMENQLKSQGMIELLNQIERINGEVAKLKGQLEVMAHDVEVTQKRQRDLYTDLDGRLRKLESSAPPAASASSTPAPQQAATPATADATTPPAATATAPPPATDPAAELKEYEAAHALFKAGKYAPAAEAFEKFLTAYPDSKFAPNAQYWIGYAHFSQKNYKSSIAAQQKLLQRYPEHQKAPDAMYNIANSQIQLADIDSAKQTLKGLLAKYPLSEAAPLAKKRLAAIESLKSKN
jgi:tol-pal system protein YbgF